jgi:hypothetical protein
VVVAGVVDMPDITITTTRHPVFSPYASNMSTTSNPAHSFVFRTMNANQQEPHQLQLLCQPANQPTKHPTCQTASSKHNRGIKQSTTHSQKLDDDAPHAVVPLGRPATVRCECKRRGPESRDDDRGRRKDREWQRDRQREAQSDRQRDRERG